MTKTTGPKLNRQDKRLVCHVMNGPQGLTEWAGLWLTKIVPGINTPIKRLHRFQSVSKNGSEDKCTSLHKWQYNLRHLVDQPHLLYPSVSQKISEHYKTQGAQPYFKTLLYNTTEVLCPNFIVTSGTRLVTPPCDWEFFRTEDGGPISPSDQDIKAPPSYPQTTTANSGFWPWWKNISKAPQQGRTD